MGLIDADALIKKISNCVFTSVITASTAKIACRWIENAPTIKPEPHWIPCSERLPDDRR